MTATLVESPPTAGTSALRARVRERLEEEFLRLCAMDRPALRDEYRIAALAHELGAAHEPHPDGGVCPRCCVLLDRGAGPQWVVLATAPELDPALVASDSSLGRALLGARPGQVVEYPLPSGVQAARVLALEPAGVAA